MIEGKVDCLHERSKRASEKRKGKEVVGGGLKETENRKSKINGRL